MSLFRRRGEPLHERLLREAGVDAVEDAFATESVYGDAGAGPVAPLLPTGDLLHGASRPRHWDAVVTATAPDLAAETLEFVVVEDGTVFMEDDVPRGWLDPLCDAVELKLRKPYRAHAVRKDGALWAISARRIEIATLQLEGDELDLTVLRTSRELRIDGHASFETVPELESRADLPAEFHAHATRIEGDRWELDLSAL